MGAEVTGLTGDAEPTPRPRLPPGKSGTELGRATAGAPEDARLRDAAEVGGEELLLPLGGGGEDGLPEPSGPAEMEVCAHAFVFEHTPPARLDRWPARQQHAAREKGPNAEIPIPFTRPLCCAVAGRNPEIAAGVPAR